VTPVQHLADQLVRDSRLRSLLRQKGETLIAIADAADYLADDLREDNFCPCPACSGQDTNADR
jgi:hypothetical protein